MPGPTNLRQQTAAFRQVGPGRWIDGAVITNPTDGTVLADTGALAAGDYLFAVNGGTTSDEGIDIQLRDAANTTTLKRIRRRPRTGEIDFFFPNKIQVNQGERLRAVQVGSMTGEVHVSIFHQEVEPGN